MNRRILSQAVKTCLLAVIAAVIFCGMKITSNPNRFEKALMLLLGGERSRCLTNDCQHVHMRSVFGVSDEVLADTNRFPLGRMRYGHSVKLSKSFWGCSEATFYLDEMEAPREPGVQKLPHRLRSVRLMRVLPDDATANTLLREAKGVIGEIAEWLGVEPPPDIELVDISKWKKSYGRFPLCGRVMSSSRFRLVDEQEISVKLMEGSYVVRDEKPILVSPPMIETDITYNKKLLNLPCCGWTATNDVVKVEKELDIGEDCADKLARAIRREIDERAARKKRREKTK